MSKRYLIGCFPEEGLFIKALHALRAQKLPIFDTYTPYAVHGLDEILGVPRSKLPWIPLVGGFIGCALALYFQLWTGGVDWPLNVGGKPATSWLALVPVSFEMTVLFGGLASLVAFFWKSKLWWGARPALKIEGITDDLFAIALDVESEPIDEPRTKEFFLELGAVRIEEQRSLR